MSAIIKIKREEGRGAKKSLTRRVMVELERS